MTAPVGPKQLPLVKVCGVRDVLTAEGLVARGAEFIGVNGFSRSPRYVDDATIRSILPGVPAGGRVYVDVAPSPERIHEVLSMGFDSVQIHFPIETPPETLRAWSEAADPQRLWLAPRMAGGDPFPGGIVALAGGILVDGHKAGAFGGTGNTADWVRFSELVDQHPQVMWILAGGLSPFNIADALMATLPTIVDVNSGIEDAPGVKNMALFETFMATVSLHQRSYGP